jgi:hypothetical protein
LCPVHSEFPVINLEKQNFVLVVIICSSFKFLGHKKSPGPFGAGVLVR